MAYIKLTLDHPIVDGESVTFKAPCDSTEVTGIKVYYVTLTETTATELSKVFTFKDAHGNNLSSIGNLFVRGAYVKVILDATNSYAYIQNADTNGYIENTMAKKTDVTGKYTKPSTGIPKTDLAEDVQTLLDKSEVFIATYGTTTGTEIWDAYRAGKTIFANKSGRYGLLERIPTGANNISFYCVYSGEDYDSETDKTYAEYPIYEIWICQGNSWKIGTIAKDAPLHASTHASGGSDPITPADIGAAPAYTYGTTDLTAGTSTLETGKLYFVYE